MTANATNFTETPNSGLIGNITFTTTNNFVKPIDFNDSATLPTLLSGQFTRVQNGLIVSDAEYGTSSLFGTLGDTFPLNGVGVVKTGLEANAVNGRPNMQIVNYTDNGADSASITNPGNPPAFSFSAFTGNVNTNPNDTYLRSGRVIGRIGWYGPMQNNGVQYIQPGSTPAAGIYVQALGDWNNATNANIPMVMAFQYSPLNAATSTPNYQRINRTFLQAANNTTTIGGATNIQFKPLARSTNATNNRSISALGNVSINPQTFVDIGGYTAGDAVSNGAGALLNVTTTASTWNGNVALRFSRTVGNTANMEFQLPVGSSNTLILRDNVTGNTIATFTNPNVVVNGNITSNNANLGNLALANFFQGDGGLLSNINVSNITGNANFANFAGNLINGNSNINIPVTDGAITINPNGIANAYVFEASGQSNINPPSTLNHIIRINTYGRSGNAAQANPISYFKSRGTSASPLSVNPGDELSRMMSFGHNGTAIQGNSFSMIRTIVDSSYVANSANIPIGITFTVTDTNGGVNNQAKTHNFFSNGNVTFAQTVNSGNLTTGGTLSVTGNANVGNLGTSGVIIATGNITGGNFITNGNITAGSSGANSSFIFNGDKTTNSGMSLFDAQFSVISNNTPTLTGYSPFRFAYYDNANASINPQRNFRGRGTFAAPAAVQSGDETWKSVYTTYADSGNTVFQIFESNIVITQNNLAGNVTANYNISPSSVYSNINLGASNTYANSLVLSNNLSAVSANVNANTYLYANGEVNTTDRVYASNVEVKTNGFVKLASYTAAGLTAITGQIGWMAAVSDSAGGGNPNGMIAFWDTTNTRWSYVHDNSAV
jgi:hypothetical protein